MAGKEHIKKYLLNTLKKGHYLWSYNNTKINVDNVPDDLLIEWVLLHLDLAEINMLFSIYPKKQIKEIWKWKMCALEPRYHNSNVLFAYIYFDIENGTRYVKMQARRAVDVKLGRYHGRNTDKN